MQIKLTNSTIKILNTMYISSLRSNGLLTLRIAGILRLAEGDSCAQVATLLRVSVRAVERWRALFLSKGAVGLPPTQASGAVSKLTKEQKQELYELILAGPQASGYASACWRSPMIAELIVRRFGVNYHPYYIPELLRGIGLSWQKATFDAMGKDATKRQSWITQRWPSIRAQAQQLNAQILFEADAARTKLPFHSGVVCLTLGPLKGRNWW